MERNIKFIILAAILTGCGNTAPAPEAIPTDDDGTMQQAVPASTVTPPNGLVGDWWATDVTINGAQDPEMDPNGKVRWHIAADSSFSMWDNTEGGPDTMSGKWGLAKSGTIFRLIDSEQNEVTPFMIMELGTEVLKLKVLEDAEAEVILHFRRQ
jgi:hypothetical protein